MSYGIGADIMVTDRILVGLEFLQRDLVSDLFVEQPAANVQADFSTITFRLGFAF